MLRLDFAKLLEFYNNDMGDVPTPSPSMGIDDYEEIVVQKTKYLTIDYFNDRIQELTLSLATTLINKFGYLLVEFSASKMVLLHPDLPSVLKLPLDFIGLWSNYQESFVCGVGKKLGMSGILAECKLVGSLLEMEWVNTNADYIPLAITVQDSTGWTNVVARKVGINSEGELLAYSYSNAIFRIDDDGVATFIERDKVDYSI